MFRCGWQMWLFLSKHKTCLKKELFCISNTRFCVEFLFFLFSHSKYCFFNHIAMCFVLCYVVQWIEVIWNSKSSSKFCYFSIFCSFFVESVERLVFVGMNKAVGRGWRGGIGRWCNVMWKNSFLWWCNCVKTENVLHLKTSNISSRSRVLLKRRKTQIGEKKRIARWKKSGN